MWYRVPTSLRPLLGSTTAPKDELYTEEEIFDALQLYAEWNKLHHEDIANLKLDRLMVANLFNKKEAVIEGNPHPLRDLQSRLLGKLQQYHRASRITQQASGAVACLFSLSYLEACLPALQQPIFVQQGTL